MNGPGEGAGASPAIPAPDGADAPTARPVPRPPRPGGPAPPGSAAADTEPPPALDQPSVCEALGEPDPGVRLRSPVPAAEPVAGPQAGPGSPRYRILGVLGQGGMGRVYLAYDRDLRRRVALKMMRDPVRGAARRFIAEAQLLGQLQHPNIVPLFDLGLTGDRKPYYTMPVVTGRTLAAVIAALRAGDAPTAAELSLGRRMQIFAHVAQAVGYAHARGVVHRDLKPANVMLGAHGEVQVLDWGLAGIFADRGVATGPDRLAASGRAGTPAYMSPEQVRGEGADEASDVWALGVMLYELLALRRAFEGKQADLMTAIVRDEPVPPRLAAAGREVPAELEAACLEALRKDPAARHRSADALRARVRDWLESEADRARRRELGESRAHEGERLLAGYFALEATEHELAARAGRIADELPPWLDIAHKGALVEAERRLRAVREQRMAAEADALGALESALGHDPANARARALLADYHWKLLEAAEERGDDLACAFLARRVARHDDGRYAARLRGDGSLALRSEPSGAEATLHPLADDGFVRTAAGSRPLGVTPIAPVPLAMGSYLVTLRRAGFAEVRLPVRVARGRDVDARVRLRTAGEIGDHMVLVPAGPFLRGGDPAVANGLPAVRAEPWLDDFLIGRHPVTMGEYLEFLTDLARSDGFEAARLRGPRPAPDAPTYLLEDAAGRLALPEVDAEGDRWSDRMPVIGITWHDALAYCAWRSRRDGRTYRLPEADEREKAARGADGRWFPWGNRFDASLCNVRPSRRERPMIVAVDEFPADVSVYGVRGLAGNVRDWLATGSTQDRAREGRLIAGGAWNLYADAARSAHRARLDPANVRDNLGFRLAATPAPPGSGR